MATGRETEAVLIRPAFPRIPLLGSRCQRQNMIGDHTLSARVRGRIDYGLGIKSGIRRLLRPAPIREPFGAPSRFSAGALVRVKDAASVRKTLDGRERLRGLAFTPQQWSTCEKTFRVLKPVRRILDDRGQMRPISATVVLDGVECVGELGGGCGRYCPMMYRDEWLELVEAAPAPGETSAVPGSGQKARIRSLAEIDAGLDFLGQRDGLTFMPEMARFAGSLAPIDRQLDLVFEYNRWLHTRKPIYILAGLHCSGAILGSEGPCDRACAMLWHADWLDLGPHG